MTDDRRSVGYGSAGLVVLVGLGLTGCAAIPTPEAPPPLPPAAAVAAPPPVATSAQPWDARPLDGGTWRYDGARRTATFEPGGAQAPLATLRCEGGAIRLLAGVGDPDRPGDVDLKTSAGTDRIRFDRGGVTLPARDPRFDRIAFSRGRFALESVGGGGMLTLPVQSEIGRLIEDCRG